MTTTTTRDPMTRTNDRTLALCDQRPATLRHYALTVFEAAARGQRDHPGAPMRAALERAARAHEAAASTSYGSDRAALVRATLAIGDALDSLNRALVGCGEAPVRLPECAMAPPGVVHVDAEAAVMLQFLVDNLDCALVDGEEMAVDAACEALFPREGCREIRLDVRPELRPVALALLADFAAHSEESAADHRRMLAAGDEPPVPPEACLRAADACRAAYHLFFAAAG